VLIVMVEHAMKAAAAQRDAADLTAF
jgi:hypothetical protein